MGTLGNGCFAISVFLIFCGFSPSSHGEFVPEDFEEKLEKLYEVIDYIRERPGQMNADATLSVTIVEANLAATIEHINTRCLGYEDRLKAIMRFSDFTRRLLLDKIIPQDEDIRLRCTRRGILDPVPRLRLNITYNKISRLFEESIEISPGKAEKFRYNRCSRTDEAQDQLSLDECNWMDIQIIILYVIRSSYQKHESWNYPDLWIRNIRWRQGVLEKGRVDGKLTYRDIRDLVMQGTPNEGESNRCLTEIVRNKRESVCRMPDLCVEILTSPKWSRGYPLTHRLFIIQVAKAVLDRCLLTYKKDYNGHRFYTHRVNDPLTVTVPMKCSQNLPYSELVVSYCSAILQDLNDIEAAGFPYQTSDLMMEQVVLCGMEGFLEFTEKRYQRLVLDWSRPGGCYSSFGNKDLKSGTRVSRRSTTATDFGCDSHATGLAAASLSLFIRQSVENA